MATTSALSSLIDNSRVAQQTGLANTGTRDAAKELNDRFLKLLVAQMSNQDPLNPLDNAQVTSQMAQINTVTGINGLNDTVAQLLTQFARLEQMQAAQLTGRNVLVDGNRISVEGGASPGGGFSLPANADRVQVEVRDANGVLVRTIEAGAGRDGIQRFAWDGRSDAGARAADGNYSFTVKATAGGKEIDATALAVRRVEAVTTANGTTQLVLAGGGSVAYADIKQILQEQA
jgi:flagellar basal-body rod modification protein FlgD